MDDCTVQWLILATRQWDYNIAFEINFGFSDFSDVPKIYYIGTAGAVEILIQKRFELTEGFLDRIVFTSMNGDVVFDDFEIFYVYERDFDDLVCKLKSEHPLASGDSDYGFVEDLEKLLFVQGFHKVVEGIDIVAIGDIVGIPGDKDNLDITIFFTELFGEADPVHASHFYVQKENIVVTGLGI